MKTEMIDLSKEKEIKIPVVFSDLFPNTKDYIAYIREKYPDPWTRIYLKTDSIAAESETMKEANIFCYFTEQELERIREREQDVILGIESASLVITKELITASNIADNLKRLISSFQQESKITKFEILLYFEEMSEEDIAILNQIRDTAIAEYASSEIHFVYPKKFEKILRVDTQNIDITHYVDIIRNGRLINKFTKEMFDDLIQFVLQEQANGKTKVAYSGLEGFEELRYIVSYLYLKYGLEFIFPDSLLFWMADSKYIYLYNRLSLYERLHFVQSLPEAFCYNIMKMLKRVDCRLQSYTTPSIEAVYDFETCEEADVSVDWRKDTFIDFREFFIEKEPIMKDATANVDYETFSDYATDKKIVDKFIKMDSNRYITIKNSILMSQNDKLYLVHTKGDFSLDVVLQIQNIIPNSHYTINETDFYCIYSHPILKKIVGEVKPACSVDAVLIASLFDRNPFMLSYYERALRWCRILEEEEINFFQKISLADIRQQPTSKYFFSCFGNPLNFDKQIKGNVPLKVTNKIMEGKRLP